MKTKSIIGIIVSLLVGFAAGYTFSHWHHPHHRFWKMGHRGPEGRLEMLSHHLSLSAEQKEQVRTVFKSKHDKFKALHKECFPKFEKLMEETALVIKEFLNPEQQVKFDELHERMKKRHQAGPPGFPKQPEAKE